MTSNENETYLVEERTIKEGFSMNSQRKEKKVKNESGINDGNMDCLERLDVDGKGKQSDNGRWRRSVPREKEAMSTKDCSESSTVAVFENREGKSKEGGFRRRCAAYHDGKGSAIEEGFLRVVDKWSFRIIRVH